MFVNYEYIINLNICTYIYIKKHPARTQIVMFENQNANKDLWSDIKYFSTAERHV